MQVHHLQGPPELGVGITYTPDIEPLLERHPELFDLIEVEPQTTWIELRGNKQRYRTDDRVLDHIAQLPGAKLVHSVGTPVGGTVRPDPVQLALLRHTIERLAAPWASDHLSFNSTPEFRTGFFLPPRQTAVGVETACLSIRDVQQALGVPVAVETGVNYLQRRIDEMDDGAFVANVVERADCGLLLDLHNIFANALNGRQPIDAFLNQLPFERVWEIHLAGGMELDGFWLDAHSGVIPDPLFELSKLVVARLPNLKAIIFEIYPAYIPLVGLDVVRTQIERLHELWDLRGKAVGQPLPGRDVSDTTPSVIREDVTPAVWEQTLGRLAVGVPTNGHGLAHQLAADPGVKLVNRLIREFRASMVIRVLPMSCRLMMLTLGEDKFVQILEDFWNATPPLQFASSEAEAFAEYWNQLGIELPYLAEVLMFERSVVATLSDDESRIVEFDFNPLPVFQALSEARLPGEHAQPGIFEIEITANGTVSANGIDLEAVRTLFPFH